jgi:hypothetical protein
MEEELMAGNGRVLLVPKTEDDVTVVRVEKGDVMQAMQMRGTLVQKLGAGPVVFDSGE